MKSLDAISKMIQKKLNWAQIHQEINDKDVIFIQKQTNEKQQLKQSIEWKDARITQLKEHYNNYNEDKWKQEQVFWETKLRKEQINNTANNYITQDKHNQQVNNLNNNIQELTYDITTLNTNIICLKEENTKYETQISKLNQQIDNYNKQLTTMTNYLTTQKEELLNYQKKWEEIKKIINENNNTNDCLKDFLILINYLSTFNNKLIVLYKCQGKNQKICLEEMISKIWQNFITSYGKNDVSFGKHSNNEILITIFDYTYHQSIHLNNQKMDNFYAKKYILKISYIDNIFNEQILKFDNMLNKILYPTNKDLVFNDDIISKYPK